MRGGRGGGERSAVYSGIGVAQCRNSVRDGILVDMEGAVHAAARAMDEAEELCGFRIEKVLLEWEAPT